MSILTSGRKMTEKEQIAYELGKLDAIKHGRWELHGCDDSLGCDYFCTNCWGFSIDEDEFYYEGHFRPWNYCPYCGAKMDEVEG